LDIYNFLWSSRNANVNCGNPVRAWPTRFVSQATRILPGFTLFLVSGLVHTAFDLLSIINGINKNRDWYLCLEEEMMVGVLVVKVLQTVK